MAEESKGRLFYGTIIHSTTPTTLHILPNALLVISPEGTILSLHQDIAPESLASTIASNGLESYPLTTLQRGQFLIPGFVDTHNHAPQWPQRGAGQGMQILNWLDEITFPNEARFRDAVYAGRMYERLVGGMLRQGVTTASYYSSLHGEGTRVLADVCLRRGQRALIGKCNMDRNSPDYYRDTSAEESIQVTRDCISHIRGLDPSGHLIRPVLTPRFAISCTEPLLRSLGDLAAEDPSLAIQTHFNEAQQEIDATLSLFPGFSNEADLYHSLGLLTHRSILAHCTIMTPYETQRLRDLDCGVAHCPTANMTVGGGFMASPIRSFLTHGIKVGLGTDSGGGYSSSMLDSMRHSLIASYARDAVYPKETEDTAALSLEEVFYIATVGGAKVVGFGDEIGNFEVGKEFDAMLVDLRDERGGINAPLEDEDSLRIIFEKFIMTGDDRNVIQVFVKGTKVHAA